ncbi:unknown [Prevotella sp. CAG:5226]|nr:unknown [Prevotella sp. CAG:5226]
MCTAAFTICTSNVNCFILVVWVIEVCIQYVSC